MGRPSWKPYHITTRLHNFLIKIFIRADLQHKYRYATNTLYILKRHTPRLLNYYLIESLKSLRFNNLLSTQTLYPYKRDTILRVYSRIHTWFLINIDYIKARSELKPTSELVAASVRIFKTAPELRGTKFGTFFTSKTLNFFRARVDKKKFVKFEHDLNKLLASKRSNKLAHKSIIKGKK